MSLLAVGLGGLLLVGDSTECPDGYAALSYAAVFTSTCPADFAPASGELRIDVPSDGSSQSQSDRVKEAMVRAGFHVDLVSEASQGRSSGDLCVTASVSFARGGDAEISCGELDFDQMSQVVSCTRGPTTAPVLGSGSSSSVSGSSSSDASGSGGDSAEGGAGGSAGAPRGSGAADGAGGRAPATTTCTIAFTKTR